MMRSLSRQRITLLEQQLIQQRIDLNETVEVTDRILTLLLDHFDLHLQTNGQMSSSNADTGHGSGDGIPTSESETDVGISGVTPVTPKSRSRETRNDASMARCEQPTCDIPHGL